MMLLIRYDRANPDRKPEHEDRQRTGASRRREEVADQRGGGRSAGGLSDSDAEASGEHLPVASRQRGEAGQNTPDQDGHSEDARAGAPIAQAAEGNADKGIEKSKGRAESAQSAVAEAPLLSDRLRQRADDLTIEEVHGVDGEQNRQRIGGARTIAHRPRSCGFSYFGKGRISSC
jgi:hypothetical protein